MLGGRSVSSIKQEKLPKSAFSGQTQESWKEDAAERSLRNINASLNLPRILPIYTDVDVLFGKLSSWENMGASGRLERRSCRSLRLWHEERLMRRDLRGRR